MFWTRQTYIHTLLCSFERRNINKHLEDTQVGEIRPLMYKYINILVVQWYLNPPPNFVHLVTVKVDESVRGVAVSVIILIIHL